MHSRFAFLDRPGAGSQVLPCMPHFFLQYDQQSSVKPGKINVIPELKGTCGSGNKNAKNTVIIKQSGT
jgi:hypothetical protein